MQEKPDTGTRLADSARPNVIHEQTGLWLVRIELYPAALRISTRRSSARSIARDPSGPLSWCTHPPRSFVETPLILKPLVLSKVMCRMPKLVLVTSLIPEDVTVTDAEYRFGASGLQNRALDTENVWDRLTLALGGIEIVLTAA